MATVTNTITSPTSVVVLPNISGDQTCYISIQGTYAGITVNFEVSEDGGNTFFPSQAVRADTGATEITRVLATSASQLWGMSISTATTIRVRASAYTSGTANVTIISGAFVLPIAAGGGTSNVNIVSQIPTGSNVIGNVGISGSIPGGSATIGAVNIASIPTTNTASQAAITILNQASTPQTTNSFTSNLSAANTTQLILAANITAVSGTNPTLVLSLDFLGNDSVWYAFFNSPVQYSTGSLLSYIGPGLQYPVAYGSTIRLRWTLTGITPSFTFSAGLLGK